MCECVSRQELIRDVNVEYGECSSGGVPHVSLSVSVCVSAGCSGPGQLLREGLHGLQQELADHVAGSQWAAEWRRVRDQGGHVVSHSSPPYSITHCVTHSLTVSLTHCVTHSLCHSLTASYPQSLIYTLHIKFSVNHSQFSILTHSITHSFYYSLTHSLTHSFTV